MIPSKREFVFNTRIRNEDVAWWKREVEPIIRRDFGGNRTAFLMDAVKRSVANYKRRSK